MSGSVFRGASRLSGFKSPARVQNSLQRACWPYQSKSIIKLRSNRLLDPQISRLLLNRSIHTQHPSSHKGNSRDATRNGSSSSILGRGSSADKTLTYHNRGAQAEDEQDNTLNGPASTLPAKLEPLPPRQPDQSIFQYYFQLGKSYLSFYKTGIKNAAWVNMKLASPVLKRWRANGGLDGAQHGEWLTRSELQLIRRRNHDSKRIPLFILMFMVCGEFTPFVVLVFSSIVPYTCRIPKQISKDRERIARSREDSFKILLRESLPGSDLKTVDDLSWKQLCHCSITLFDLGEARILNYSRQKSSLGLQSSLWPSRLLPLPPKPVLRHRLKQHLRYLDIDDAFINNNVQKVNAQELEIALSERGFTTNDLSEKEQRHVLSRWLERLKGDPTRSALLQWLTPP